MKIDVYATLNSVQEKELKESIVVVVDVLRASSTIITALYNGCREVIPTIEIEEAIRLAKNYEKDTLLLGEKEMHKKLMGLTCQILPLNIHGRWWKGELY
jgi:2-phosphosulfolactate phosphatase